MSLFDRSLLLADIAPPDNYTNNFDYCIKIVNLKQYPKHLFFIKVSSIDSSRSKRGYLIVNADRCTPVNGYRPVAKIAVISKNLVKPKDLLRTDAGIVLQNNKLEKLLMIANTTIDRPGSLPLIYQGKKVAAEVKIQSIDREKFILFLPNNPVQIPNWIFLPLIGLAILGWTLANRKYLPVSSK